MPGVFSLLVSLVMSLSVAYYIWGVHWSYCLCNGFFSLCFSPYMTKIIPDTGMSILLFRVPFFSFLLCYTFLFILCIYSHCTFVYGVIGIGHVFFPFLHSYITVVADVFVSICIYLSWIFWRGEWRMHCGWIFGNQETTETMHT